MTTQSSKKLGSIYFENLDALRFLAAFSVFVFHYFRDINTYFPTLHYNFWFDKVSDIADKGSLGVNFFFVLSGFLITYLIFHEKRTKGKFTLWKFLVRRTLRIWPLYFIIGIIAFALFPLIFEWYSTDHDPVYYIFFLANFDEIYNGINDPYNFLTAPWSVAVEEQFYLFWGIALFVIFKLKNYALEYLILALYILSFVFRWINVDNEMVIYYHTFSVCQDILTGAFVGITLFKERTWILRLKNLSIYWTILIYIAGFGICVLKNKIFAGDLIIFERFFLSLFFAFIILDQIQGKHSIYKIGKIRVFNYLGKISYGLYMYHLIVLFLISLLIESQGWTGYWLIPFYFLVSLALTIGAASLSYHLLEARLLKLKPK